MKDRRIQEADHFACYLAEILWDDHDADSTFVDVEHIGFGVLRVNLKSGTSVTVSVDIEAVP